MASIKTQVTGALVAVVASVAVLVIILVFAFGTKISTAPDQAGLWYKSGPLSSTSFDHCVEPGTREMFKGVADKTYKYPAGQRTYGFSGAGAGEVEVGPLVALTKDGIEMQVQGLVRFDMNTECEVLRAFHEEIGLKNDAYMDGDKTSEGWVTVLNTYLGQSLQSALNDSTQQYTWKELYNNPDKKREWETSISEALPGAVRQAMDGDYFKNYSLTIQKPTLPQELLDALKATQTAVEQNTAQTQKNATVKTELESIKQLVEVLGPNGYNTYEAIKRGDVSVLPIPQGSDVVINGSNPAPATVTEEVPTQ